MDEIRKTTKIQELTYELKIKDVMSENIETVSSKMPISSLRDILYKKRISGIPIVNDNKLVGIISIEDFIKCLEQGEMDALIEDKMTKNIKTLYADEPLVHAVMKFEKYGFGRFPIISRKDKKLVGIITKSDIIKGVLKKLETAYHDEEERRYRASHIFNDIVADEVFLKFQYYVEGKNFDRAGEAATGLKKTLYRLGLSPEIVRRAAISTYEAEINIVAFTEGGEIIAYIDPHQIKIIITDKGPGIPDVKKAMEPGFSTAPGWVRELGFGAGMGLSNIKKFTDKMTLRSTVEKGTHLEIIIKLSDYRNED
ncbi:MAG: CBS domain-containing protein [Candidatus Cloacimonetes bacterium]|nr:CBS domain-containing protein [Candidatus Cloacimonadota bacterium]MBL7149361.1 CBS domain-containing protein [Candidatus Cloacimonadota bacterium]